MDFSLTQGDYMTDEVSESTNKENANFRSIPKYWIVLGLLVCAHAAFGAIFSLRIVKSNATVFVLMLGCLLSQPILFAIWAALAPQRFYRRFLWSLFFCTLVCFSAGLGILVSEPQNLFFFTISDIVLFIATTPILLLVRRLSRWQIIHSYTAHVPSDYQANQFGVKHLIILITITALACGLFRTLIVTCPPSSYPSVAAVVAGTCVVIVVLFPIVFIPWITLAYLKNMVLSIFYTFILFGIYDMAVYFIVRILNPEPEIFQIAFFVQLGASISVFLSMLMIRLCGFRMVRG
jgi:hypothetical protein